MKFLSVIVVISIILCVIGGVVSVIFQTTTGVELSPTLIDKWYTVFGIELGASAVIQIAKIVTDELKRRNRIAHMKENGIQPKHSDFKNEQDSYFGEYVDSDYSDYDTPMG